MTKKNDGGPASEMTVRQVYVKAALQGLLTNPSLMSPGQLKASRHHNNICVLANEIADAMLTHDHKE